MSEIIHLDDILLRKAKEEDLETFEQIASTVHFDIGLHNWKLYYSISPDGYWVFEEPKKKIIVGILSGHSINDEFFWGHQVIILPEYRQKSRFRSTVPLVMHKPYFATNRNATNIFAFRHDPVSFGHKLIGFSGRLNPVKNWEVKPPKGVTIMTLPNDSSQMDQRLLANLYKYDEALYENIPAPKRRYWLDEWLFPKDPSHSVSVVAYSEQDWSVLGFGVGRLQTKLFSSMAPVYADSDDVAYALLCQLANHLKDREHDLYMEFFATKRICFKFVREAGLTQTYTNFRVYNPKVYNFPIEKQFCDQEFWPL